MADVSGAELREDLDQVKDQLKDRMSWIREEFEEWMILIKEYGDEERRQQKEEAFHRFRLEGTDACVVPETWKSYLKKSKTSSWLSD
ncbi:MAG: hypothetical protein GY696_16400 [Gammaproteobacteria bacterium]|nr:hypothetical protein [Gammaproteobacteria bacterium]